jgi:hypothetical protein
MYPRIKVLGVTGFNIKEKDNKRRRGRGRRSRRRRARRGRVTQEKEGKT